MEQSGTKKRNTRKVAGWLEMPIALIEGPSKKKQKTNQPPWHRRANIYRLSVCDRHRPFEMY